MQNALDLKHQSNSETKPRYVNQVQ